MLHKALRLMRVFHDMNQTELAQKLEISKSHLSGIESGDKKPSLELLTRYAEVFEVPLSSVMFFAEHLDDDDAKEKARTFVASKVLAMMDFIAERSGRPHAE